jgi:TctA family transporter
MLYSRGDLTTFVTHPISGSFLGLAVLILVASFYLSARKKRIG